MASRAIALLGLLLSTIPAAAQQPPTAADRRAFGEGTHAFRAVLNKVGAKPLTNPADLFDNPANKVLVVLGRTEFLEPILASGSLGEFFRGGGAALIATDRATSDAMFEQLGVRVSGRLVTVPRYDAAAQFAYRGSLLDCPMVEPFNIEFLRFNIQDLLPDRLPKLFDGLPRNGGVATNLPSCIERSIGLPLLATIPERGQSFRLADGSVVHGKDMFAVGGPFKKGRLLVLADHSVFINDMMLQADNDNIAFAFNVARWLTDNGKRTEVLFYEDGNLQTNFDVSLEYPTPPVPPVEALVPVANQFLAEWERENPFSRFLVRAFGGRNAFLRTAALLLTVVLLLVGLYRFLHARHRTEARVPRLPARLDALAPPVPAVEQRQQALLAQGNLAEAARELAYETFAALGRPPAAGDAPPAVDVDGKWWQRLRWRRRVRRLWDVAARGPAGRTSAAGLRLLAAELRELHAAVTGGQVRLADDLDGALRRGEPPAAAANVRTAAAK